MEGSSKEESTFLGFRCKGMWGAVAGIIPFLLQVG